ncbi:MAG TPA: glycerol kinase [Firmicutes bacterium]|nr:glycerol kinase [Bacillota bacterium]
MSLLLAIDQGTTSTRAIVFNKKGEIVEQAQREIECLYPQPGWVEQDGNEIWISTLSVVSTVLLSEKVNIDEIKGIGITNQRETTIMWDKVTGKPLYHAIVWQSRQTEAICEQWKAAGYEEMVKEKTGLLIDPYFSASKIRWMLDHVDGLQEKIEAGRVLFGTVDSYLVWKLSGGKAHITDVTNASRTMLFNIHTECWDEELLNVFNIPSSILPEVKQTSEIYAHTVDFITGKPLPLACVCGDQQAALFGQACFDKGNVKNTYGTGCFVLMNTGQIPVKSEHGLLTTIAWKMNNQTYYALEGSVFIGGSAIQWLRDGLRMVKDAKDSEMYANRVEDCGGVYVVPTFVGLGTPYWDSEVRGGVLGLTRGTSKEHFIRATLEAIAYQSKDVITAMEADLNDAIAFVKVDGGATKNDFLMQFQSDILGVEVVKPAVTETTALGAAYLAGLATGVYQDTDEIKALWLAKTSYEPKFSDELRNHLYNGWQKAIEAVRIFKF